VCSSSRYLYLPRDVRCRPDRRGCPSRQPLGFAQLAMRCNAATCRETQRPANRPLHRHCRPTTPARLSESASPPGEPRSWSRRLRCTVMAAAIGSSRPSHLFSWLDDEPVHSPTSPVTPSIPTPSLAFTSQRTARMLNQRLHGAVAQRAPGLVPPAPAPSCLCRCIYSTRCPCAFGSGLPFLRLPARDLIVLPALPGDTLESTAAP
jgi:hypothetical protein